jgi:predicted GIY-YIG superfamily endonuclease
MSHRPPVVDTRNDRPHYVYRIFDAADRLLYVGCTEDVTTRMFFHTSISTPSEASWEIRRDMARHTSEEHPNKAAAHAAEIHAIKTEMPLLNRQHNPGRFKRVLGKYVAVEQVAA